jgi:hypothetical protein
MHQFNPPHATRHERAFMHSSQAVSAGSAGRRRRPVGAASLLASSSAVTATTLRNILPVLAGGIADRTRNTQCTRYFADRRQIPDDERSQRIDDRLTSNAVGLHRESIDQGTGDPCRLGTGVGVPAPVGHAVAGFIGGQGTDQARTELSAD